LLEADSFIDLALELWMDRAVAFVPEPDIDGWGSEVVARSDVDFLIGAGWE
jgi:hypothetical protein